MGDGFDPEARWINDLEQHLPRIDHLAGHDVGDRNDAADRCPDLFALDERRHQLFALLPQRLDLALGFIDLDGGIAKGAFR